jgi:hypothetical protein
MTPDPSTPVTDERSTAPKPAAVAPSLAAAAREGAAPREIERHSHAIELRGLNAWYGGGAIHSIKDLSLSFPPNQATALIGP